MTVEVTEVKETRIKWASSEAVIYAGSLKMIPIAQSPTITLAEQVVKDPNGFVEYAQRIADALNESKPKEPRKARKDKGTKRPTIFVNTVKERMERNAFKPDELTVLTEAKPVDNTANTGYKPEASTVYPVVDTGKDIFSTFEMKTPAGKGEPYIFRMGGQEVQSKTMRKGVLDLLNECFLTDMNSDVQSVLSGYPDSPQLQQVRNILFPKNV